MAMGQGTAPAKVDGMRERELYRYFKPPTADSIESCKPEEVSLSASAASSPDTTLTALAQLCAIRLGASRSMISVIDREKQYFIAEATKTISIADTSKSEVEGDGLWAGCSTVDKAGRLCERTIELPCLKGNRAPLFTVTDLSADERFNELPFVTGAPYFKFYAGTPLTTKKGINIGSLFILDVVARPQLTPEQEEFLGTMAQIVMKHMEITSEAEERIKVTRMSMGLNAFVEGKSQLGQLTNEQLNRAASSGKSKDSSLVSPRAAAESSPRTNHKRPLNLESRGDLLSHRPAAAGMTLKTSQEPPSVKTPRRASRQSTHSDHSEDTDTSVDEFDTGLISADSGHRATCTRAATLLSESLDLNGEPRRGGVVFFDTTSQHQKQAQKPSSTTTQDIPPAKPEGRPAEVISQAADEGSFIPITEDALSAFLRRFPHGKLWTFDVDGTFSSSEDDPASPRENNKSDRLHANRMLRRQMEARLLQHHFPGCKQLLFTGLWDAAASRWFLGGFAWTTASHQIFSVNSELNYFRAFGNSVTAEVSRLASIAADRQKADFIGSISHEFRSPLHGILASAEFLMDTQTDAFQNSLVDTVLSCGRTLLDTINHILDYSKINSFERTWRGVRKPGAFRRGHNHNRAGMKREAPPMLNIYAPTNVASVAEEVVEGVYVGQIYQDISSTDHTDLSIRGQKLARGQGVHMSFENQSERGLVAKPVEVILDIPHDDYTFITQPGALKRIIMNIFGNALKYTQRGSIVLHLSLDPKESQDGAPDQTIQERMLQIKVTDTGKGISKEYIRTSLFNPFCQEDALASGTGLGLSIVKSIVTMLNGTIDVQSDLGVGTEVLVRLPLSRVPGNETPASTPPSALADQPQDESMARLSRDHGTAEIALYGFKGDLQQLGQTVKLYIEEWYGLKTVSGLSVVGLEQADLVILEERALPTYLEQRRVEVPVLVFCGTLTIRPESISHRAPPKIIEYVSKPFGPHKLAKGIYESLNRDAASKSGLPSGSKNASNTTEQQVEAVVPDLNLMTLGADDPRGLIEVETNGTVTAPVTTDNARMALHSSESSNDTNDTKCELISPVQTKTVSSPVTRTSQRTSESVSESQPRNRRSPRVLLVDDNKINLRLLQTFMKKRKYEIVDSADNGQLAVDAATAQKQGYDIIFMDISMPVMNGFEATRVIRDIEEERRDKDGKATFNSAFIIALTGLASGRDQTEAFTSGVDLFMTKPVSFKEVGLLLDNWEQQGGLGHDGESGPTDE